MENVVSTVNRNIRRIMEGESSPGLLRESAGLALDLPPAIPLWADSANHLGFDDLDQLLAGLSKLIEKLYNRYNKQVFVFSPDVFLAKVGYEAARRGVSSRLISTLKHDKQQGDFMEAQAVFVPVLPYEQPEIPFLAANAALLNPGRFNSLQLKSVAAHLEEGAAVELWDATHVKKSGLALAVRQNDREKLDFLLARWGIETAGTEKDNQTRYIVSFMEAMAEWVKHGE